MLTLPGPVVTVDWLQAHHSDPSLRVADVRWSLNPPPGRERYAAGHLPGAVFLDLGADGCFLDPDALRARYAGLGAGERPTIVYCGSGTTAAHDLLAMELAGIPDGRLYEGSWSDWSSDPRRPAATGPTP